ncbi:PstS family phosphate ABC transporter substrate-binding protein [Haloferax larsenii]|uniref:Phosphate ABC transporter substrate-binding protein, PhoT family n=1 Tax=Haloferax larsenii TaxID=302484 RepID=A0A1H7RFI1_HALLR|nr:PstS family phosphate ABC transporter substrate-binding protein [Haloferax larsenii]SEL58825.1 phosphate ABC transporter substrate-binding protein, PhoT family [Haloferax larsenii]
MTDSTPTDRSVGSTAHVNRRTALGTLGSLGLTALTGCLGGEASISPNQSTTTATPENLSGRIRIAGSSTVYPLTLAVGNAFMKEHSEVTVSVTSTGTGGGFADFFCSDRTAINDASRAIAADEAAACERAGVEPIGFQIAIDAITVVVNPDADWVDCVTLDELADIWGVGGATTWSDVRPEWPDEPLDLYGPTTASGTFDYFGETVLGSDTDQRTDHETTEQDNVIARNVSDATYSMGYFGLAYYLQNKDAVRAVSIDEGSGCVSPSPDHAKSDTYGALSRPLYIYVAADELPRPEVAAFVRYYLQQSMSTVPARVGYVPVTERMATANLDTLDGYLSKS